MIWLRTIFLLIIILIIAGCSSEPKLSYLSKDATILTFGDSLTYGVGAKTNESYPAVLEKLIHRRVVNVSIPGLQTKRAAELLPKILDQYHPNLVILCIGGNDLLKQKPISDIQKNLGIMISAALSRKIDLVILAVPSLNIILSVPWFYKELGEIYCVPMEENLVARLERTPRYKSDAIHLNAKGYREMAEGVAKFLKKYGAI